MNTINNRLNSNNNNYQLNGHNKIPHMIMKINKKIIKIGNNNINNNK